MAPSSADLLRSACRESRVSPDHTGPQTGPPRLVSPVTGFTFTNGVSCRIRLEPPGGLLAICLFTLHAASCTFIPRQAGGSKETGAQLSGSFVPGMSCLRGCFPQLECFLDGLLES